MYAMPKQYNQGDWIPVVKQLMRDNTMTQQQMADRLGITRGAFCHWMTGTRRPRHEDLVRMSEILRVPITQLVLPYFDTPTPAETKLLADLGKLSKDNQALITAMIRSLAAKNGKK